MRHGEGECRVDSRVWHWRLCRRTIAVLPALAVALTSLGTTSAQQSATSCSWLHDLLTRCQPRDGAIYFIRDTCPNGASGHINYARVRLMTVGQAPSIHPVEGWWVIWAPSEQRWYKLYDGRTTADPAGETREMYFCGLPCGAYPRGYEWVNLDPFPDPNFTRVSAEVMGTSCYDCRTPTPTPWFKRPDPSSTPPTACIWRAFVPYAWRE